MNMLTRVGGWIKLRVIAASPDMVSIFPFCRAEADPLQWLDVFRLRRNELTITDDST